ncbi:MAG: selenocysteine-specific translation elongation factor [Akkermansiaceae bacterium]|nr:selenocysteine-specific translation elongation factor [Akkermansiaceae bacterium]
MSRNYIIGTAGHIDHGKSTLVQTLTGTNPDRLPEEKERGVTIELGFAHFSLPVPQTSDDTFELGVVDVPGHADFVNNMVAGVGSIDLGIFVVAADDSWMPQSEEHLQILTYLGIRNFIVALTKADLCEDLEFVTEMLADDLQGTALEGAPIVPVSAPTGFGMELLKETIANTLLETPAPRNFGHPRLAVDRAFSPKGVGTVVTGTLAGGELKTGDSLIAYPSGLKTSVRAIQNHSSSVDHAMPGMRTALNLPDLPLTSKGKKGVSRGNLLVGGSLAEASYEVDAELIRSVRPIPGQKGTLRPLKSNHRIYVHHGSGRTQARVLFPEGNTLHPGESTIAQLRFDHPVHSFVGERIVIRELSGEATIAGGTILDAHPSRRNFRGADRQLFLTERATAPDDLQLLLRTHLIRDHFLTEADLVQALPFSPAGIKAALKKMTKANEVVALGEKYLSFAPYWKGLVKESSQLVQEYHKKHPDQIGMTTELFKKNMGAPMGIPGLLEALLIQLSEKNFKVGDNLICHNSHSLELPPELEAPAAEILKTLDNAGLNPPLPGELQGTPSHTAAYKFLSRTRQIIPLEPKVTLGGRVFQSTVAKVTAFLEKNGQATVSELRQELNTSRKVIMPLLDRLDRDGVTIRNGDYRTLVPRG